MRYRRLGTSDLTVSCVGLGCLEFGRRTDERTATDVVHRALDLGVTLFDTAANYGDGDSERFLGRALGKRRDEVVIATKWGTRRHRQPGNPVGSRRYVHAAADEALERLGTDYIDLFQLHLPDPETPIDETLGALSELVDAGKVRHPGCSNFSGRELLEADRSARTRGTGRFISVQREYGLLNRSIERDVVPVCLEHGIGLMAWRPLGMGLLSGRYRAGDVLPDKENTVVDASTEATVARLSEVADRLGVTPLQLAIGGLLARPAISCVLIGTSRAEHLADNVAAAQWIPTSDQEHLMAMALGNVGNDAA